MSAPPGMSKNVVVVREEPESSPPIEYVVRRGSLGRSEIVASANKDAAAVHLYIEPLLDAGGAGRATLSPDEAIDFGTALAELGRQMLR